jgi:CxxC motif-containing protein (DUF1111 family)
MLFAALWTVVSVRALVADDVPLPPGRDSSRELVQAGRELFMMNFARPSRMELGDKGNGLGPVFNETSCAGCHFQGGVGGAGDRDVNVLLLGIVSRPRGPANMSAAIAAARQTHPGLGGDSAVKVVHRFAIGDGQDAAAYDQWRDGLLQLFGGADTIKPVRKDLGPVTLELSQRNTTALWGAGLIDKLRREGGEALRRRIATEQPEQHRGITGRVPKTPAGVEGWFGWRGQVSTLDDFTLSACAIELGLQVPGVDEGRAPLGIRKSGGRRDSGRHLDLTAEQCAALEAFVHSLPRPIREIGTVSEEQAAIESGERVFDRIGCAACHVPDLGFIAGIYSDLLLHDMGYETSDAQTATPETVIETIADVPTYYEVPIRRPMTFERPTNPEQEWKTPPLWGVSDSAPYFHDGRAATLKEAILLHAGEAERSATAFQQLDDEDRHALLAFLSSLRAPKVRSDEVARR